MPESESSGTITRRWRSNTSNILEIERSFTINTNQEVAVMRTIAEVARLKKALQSERDRLPERDGFGHSNDGSKAELQQHIDELTTIEETGKVPISHSEIGLWFACRPTDIGSDYGVD